MGVVLFVGQIMGGQSFYIAGWRYLALIWLVLVGLVSYAGFGQALGAFTFAEYRTKLRRSS
jgi:putative peptidoglycan lipid II flippase